MVKVNGSSNTLAYCDTVTIAVVKSFIVQACGLTLASKARARNTKGGSIPVPLTSSYTDLESPV